MGLVEMYSDGCGLFEFDMATPLFIQIAEEFDQLEPIPLNEEQLAIVKERPGIYGLHHEGELVYVGKADDNAQVRLRKHWRQLHGRVGITPEEVSFRCLHFANTWDPFKPEAYMIKTRRPSWNSRGFGPNDPGRNRDSTHLAENHWHVRYPVDPDYPCPNLPAGIYEVLNLLRLVARNAPYWVRFQGNRSGSEQSNTIQSNAALKDFEESKAVIVPRNEMPIRELLLLAVRSLPDPFEWQLTRLPSHLLLYREKNVIYPRMERLWPPSS